jgi:enamine deaminase RidA (YjgF/YER057c/UK114 family)
VKTPEERLEKLGLELPTVRRTTGNYVGCVRTGNLIFTAAQGIDQFHGKLGRELTSQDGYQAAEYCMLNLLAVIKRDLGNLSKVERIVRLLVMVNATTEFNEQSVVANGASDLLEKLFGDKGKQARSTVGMTQLPSNNSVEIEMIIEVKEQNAEIKGVTNK